MIEKMNITSAKYIKDPLFNNIACIKATIDGQEFSVPLAVGNGHYDEIMRQVEAGELTIEEAD